MNVIDYILEFKDRGLPLHHGIIYSVSELKRKYDSTKNSISNIMSMRPSLAVRNPDKQSIFNSNRMTYSGKKTFDDFLGDVTKRTIDYDLGDKLIFSCTYPMMSTVVNIDIFLQNSKPLIIPLVVADNIDNIRRLSSKLGISIKMSSVEFIDYFVTRFIVQGRTKFHSRSHVMDMLSGVEMGDLVQQMMNISPRFLSPGEILSAYLSGEIVETSLEIFKSMQQSGVKSLSGRLSEIYEYVMQSQPFGIVMAWYAIHFEESMKRIIKEEAKTKPQQWIQSPESPINTITDYMFRMETMGESVSHILFLLDIDSHDGMVLRMKECGIIPRVNVMYYQVLINNAEMYKDVFDRKPNIRHLTEFTTRRGIEYLRSSERSILSHYTDMELYTNFGIDILRFDRRVISRWLPNDLDTARWRMTYYGCNNLDLVEALTGDTFKAEMERVEDGQDIIVGYGTFYDHRCINIDLLKDYLLPTTGELNVPGYMKPYLRDDKYPNDSLSNVQVFTIEQARELYYTLAAIPQAKQPQVVHQFIDSLYQVFFVREGITMYNARLRKHFSDPGDGLSEPFRRLFLWLMYELLVLSLSMIKWRGPGYPYPYNFREDELANNANLCTEEEMDVNVIRDMQDFIVISTISANPDDFAAFEHFKDRFRSILGDEYTPDDPSFREQINNLNSLLRTLTVVNITSGSPSVTVGPDSNIVNLLNYVSTGDKCTAHTSDIIRDSIVHVIKYLTDESDEEINNGVNTVISTNFGIPRDQFQPFDVKEFVKSSGHFDPQIEISLEMTPDAIKEKILRMVPEYMRNISDHAFFWTSDYSRSSIDSEIRKRGRKERDTQRDTQREK